MPTIPAILSVKGKRMVQNLGARVIFCLLVAAPCNAQSLRDTHFGAAAPHSAGCFARDYSPAHLVDHPQQRVTRIGLAPVPLDAPPGQVLMNIGVMLRDRPDFLFSSFAYCEPNGPRFDCALEGDAGTFTLTGAPKGALLLTVGPNDMVFEGQTDVITLRADAGDDRVFLIPNVSPDLCN